MFVMYVKIVAVLQGFQKLYGKVYIIYHRRVDEVFKANILMD